MNAILNSISTGLQSILNDPLLFSISILVIVNIVLIGFIFSLSRRVTKLLRGKNGGTLEKTIVDLCNAINEFDDWRESATGMFKNMDTRLKGSLRGTSLVRFNPFKGTGSGGNQSFAAAFLDEEGKGIVVSSMYSRERVSMFGKPLEKFSSPFELTLEEKQAVTEAKKKLK